MNEMQPSFDRLSARMSSYLDGCRDFIIDEIREILPDDNRHTGNLYELMLDYPLRHGKSLRPAISIAACRATGGSLAAVITTAAVLELYHNAFLIHDDVEDQSTVRRSEPTLQELHGVPVAVNVGDGMLAATIQPLLENVARIGLGRALRILRIVSRMSRESAEGQMLELDWIRRNAWDLVDRDYLRMVHKKTGWYSFMAPAMAGAVAAGLPDDQVAALARTFVPLGIGFQIKDDILNLTSNGDSYGKDLLGDLWEGKHTLILIHALRVCGARERRAALEVLGRPHPNLIGEPARFGQRLDGLLKDAVKSGALDTKTAARLSEIAADTGITSDVRPRTAEDVAFLHDLVSSTDSIGYAERVAERHCWRYLDNVERILDGWPESTHAGFLRDLGQFVIRRTQ